MITKLEVKLDPIHKTWCVLQPIDHEFRRHDNPEHAYSHFEHGDKRSNKHWVLAMAYSNIENDMCKPGTVNLHCAIGRPNSGKIQSVHWTMNVADFTEANHVFEEFWDSLPDLLDPYA